MATNAGGATADGTGFRDNTVITPRGHYVMSVDTLFPAHLATLRSRADAALAVCGFDGLALYSGRPVYHFLDDAGPPFKPNPHFIQWAPLSDSPDCFVCYVPGRRPLLSFHQPADYWHLPPRLPDEAWLGGFDVRTIRDPAESRALLAKEIGSGRLALVGEWQPEFADWPF